MRHKYLSDAIESILAVPFEALGGIRCCRIAKEVVYMLWELGKFTGFGEQTEQTGVDQIRT